MDAAWHVRSDVEMYERNLIGLRELRKAKRKSKRKGGRSPSVAWHYLMSTAERWGATDDELAQQLAAVGFVVQEDDVVRLRDAIKKRRLRRA